ncbi:carbohydrate ABC transporter permease [Paenibacillus sp. YN15]|uniref:carbohydrate ABC transporter permease n=1 Tax=Paenibacillus sp. YN15 TaxID=1742774 RepID=UPI000DCB342E|nr:carbohydrate ABC transporter permease [Paenibacillus sp. YN15]RAU98619.1 ABC transporter permease [Paenibacillus sp. YN15]
MHKLTPAEKIVHALIYLALLALMAICLFPFLYVLGVSFTSQAEAMRRSIVIIPEHITLAAYKEILGTKLIYSAYRVTLFVTVAGTLLNLAFTMLTAYPLARKSLKGRQFFLLYIVFTMLFSGGMIPQYLLVKELGMLNSVWSLVVPGLISAFNLLIVKGFFEQLPEAIDESARIDGAGELRILWSVVLPLSSPILATIGLFYAVGHWNSFFDAVLYIQDADKYPLQVVLRNILLGATALNNENIPDMQDAVNPISIQMAAVIVTTVPILLVYPFIQKHFAKGVLLGSVKG